MPDAKTAMEIGMTIIRRQLPADEVAAAQPFAVADMKDYWVIYGNRPLGTKEAPWVGGTVIVEVDRESGAILRFIVEQ